MTLEDHCLHIFFESVLPYLSYLLRVLELIRILEPIMTQIISVTFVL